MTPRHPAPAQPDDSSDGELMERITKFHRSLWAVAAGLCGDDGRLTAESLRDYAGQLAHFATEMFAVADDRDGRGGAIATTVRRVSANQPPVSGRE